jgi:NADPH-dependent ferric siderophore reductase
MGDGEPGAATRIRREPPRFRRARVTAVADLSPCLRRVTFTGADDGPDGDELHGLVPEEPAASVRVLLPPAVGGPLVIPAWNGNEFLLPDGSRPIIRTLTPRSSTAGALDVAVVLHEGGAASAWAAAARPGADVAISGPGRGYEVPAASAFVLGGDETALPAIGQLLEAIPAGPTAAKEIDVHIEVARPEARLPLPAHPAATITWHDLPPGAAPGAALVAAFAAATIPADARVWVAGEAAAVQQIRRDVLEVRRIPRSQTSIRGYWKHGRAESSDRLRDG